MAWNILQTMVNAKVVSLGGRGEDKGWISWIGHGQGYLHPKRAQMPPLPSWTQLSSTPP